MEIFRHDGIPTIGDAVLLQITRTYVRRDDFQVTGTRLAESESVGEDTIVYAGVFQFFYLRLAIFFGCLGIFMNLFRGELLDKK